MQFPFFLRAVLGFSGGVGYAWAQIAMYAGLPVLVVAVVLVTNWFAQYLRRRVAQGPAATLLLHKKPLALALATVLLGCSLTGYVANQYRQNLFDAARQRFLQQVEKTESAIQTSVGNLVQPLNGIRGTVVARDKMSREEFAEMVDALDMRGVYPGVRAFGLVERVTPTQKSALFAAQRANGFSDFAITAVGPEGPLVNAQSDKNADSMVIRFIEPYLANRPALGLDIGSDPLRREAAESAMLAGTPAMTRPINVLVDPAHRAGFLMLVPIYAHGDIPATVEQRLSTLQGWAMAVVVWAELVAQVGPMDGHPTDFQIFDALQPSQANLIYDSLTPDGAVQDPDSMHREQGRLFSITRPLLVASQVLYLRTESTPEFDASFDVQAPLNLALWGSTLSVMLAIVVWLLLAGRSRAESLARGMTHDLERLANVAERTSEALAREKQRAANILAGINIGTWESNLVTGEWNCSERWYAMMGYTQDDVQPDADVFWQQLLHPQDSPRINSAWRACVDGPEDGYSCEVRVRRKDGSWMWILSRAKVMTRTSNGRAEWIGGIHTDITESKLNELSLREMESFLDRARRLAGVGAWEINLKSGAVIWSAQTCTIHGVQEGYQPTVEETFSFFPASAQAAMRNAMALSVERGTSWDMESEYVNSQGLPLWVRSFGEVEFDEIGPVRLVGAIQDITREKLNQLEVQKTGALLQGAIDAIGEAFVLFDPDDRLVYCNEKYREMYASTGDIFQVGSKFEDLLRASIKNSDFGESAEEWIQKRLAHHRAAQHATEQRLTDGRWVRIVDRKMDDGHTVGFRVDITSLKVATELAQSVSADLAQEQARLRGILEGTNVGTWEWGVTTGSLVVNQRWAEIAGYQLTELAPLDANTWINMLHPQDVVVSNEKLQLHFDKEADFFDCESRLRHKDGHWVWVLDRGKVSRWGPDGKPVAMSGTRMEITARKVAEQTVRELSASLQNVLDSAVNVGIVSSGLDRTIRVFNKGAEILLGYTAEEVVHKESGSIFFDPTEMAALGESLALIYGREPTAQELVGHLSEQATPQEWTLVKKDGERFKASMTFSPMFGADAAVVGHLCIIHDVSRQKEYESSLREAMLMAEQSSVAKSQFLANMSHEIRTPMNAILGMLQLLNTTPLDRRQDDYVDKAKSAARSLLGLLNDILDFSKVEAGKMQLAPEPFALETMLEDVSVILSSNLGGRPVDLVYDIDSEVPQHLVGDALRIKQVLINLGGNAVKFTEQGQVVIRIRTLARNLERARLQIAVIDSGIGIAPQNQARIFEAFTQAEANTTRRFGGTGLGLVISTRLIRLMGSELELISQVGVGSTFFFSLDLPIAELPASPARPWLKHYEAQSQRPVNAMLVDDNPVAVEANAAMLRGFGWMVHHAASGHAALDWMQANLASKLTPLDVVFLDSRMPEMDGWQTLSLARQVYQGHIAPKFIMLTGDNREVLAKRAEGEMAVRDGMVVKPLTRNMFAQAFDLACSDPDSLVDSVDSTLLSPLAGMRVLLVEDNLINQQVARELLQGEGALVTLADNGLAGLESIKAAKPMFDAVLLDLQMPVMDGLTAARLLRQDPRFDRLPVIAMTANAMESDRQECLNAGMNDHVGKPFDLKNLTETLVRHTAWAPKRALAAAIKADGMQLRNESATQSRDQWPQGLDMDAALARMGGNRALMQRSIRKFLADAQHLEARVGAMLADGARDDARRELHAFKGLAATLGATALSKLAAQAESALLGHGQVFEADKLMLPVATMLQTVTPELESVAARLVSDALPTDNSTSTAEIDRKAFSEALRALLQALQAGDMEAMVLHANLHQLLANSSSRNWDRELEPLNAAMADLELQRGALECESLLRQLTS